MPSVIGHFFAGCAISAVAPPWRRSMILLCITIACAMLPDLDVLSFRLGIPYDHMLGHRGLTHSIPFATIWAILVYSVYAKLIDRGRQTPLWIMGLFFLATVSHGLLDAMTTGGRGEAFFAPFSDERYFLPWRFISVSPLRVAAFFSEWGERVLISEIKYIGVPSLCIILVSAIVHRIRRR